MKNRERMRAGVQRMRRNKKLFLIPVIYLIILGTFTYWGKGKLLTLQHPFSSEFFGWIFIILMAELALIGVLGIITLIGYPREAKEYERQLLKIGFIDKTGSAPVLISKMKEKNGYVMDFFSEGIPLIEYRKHAEEIETALNIKIISVEFGKDMRHVVLKTIPGSNEKKGMIRWDDKYLSDKDFELVLGESYFGMESIDISGTPHILIGGGTGSGKTKLLKLVLMESIKKGAKVFIADFKGGIDYPKVWHERCSIITEAAQFEKQLDEILALIEKRRNLLYEAQTPNIADYNEKTGENLPRIIVACDELAEVLDKTGLEKDEKALVGRIESKLSTIARQGRAYGIHLVLATQRPDADVLKGQIKNNLPFRVCGRADKVLSQIILDSSEAAEKITPQDQGIFLTNTGVLFKAYYIEDDCLEGVNADDRKAGTEGQTNTND